MSDAVPVLVRHADGETTLRVTRGTRLRDALRDAGLSPYSRLTERVNCGGRGLCATCGVRLREPAVDGDEDGSVPAPEHWHDALAARFGYPRLSCQVVVDRPLVVELVADKRVWGGRERRRGEHGHDEG